MDAVDAVNQRFSNDLHMDLVRVPMVAQWGAADNKFNNVLDFAADAKGKGMDIFLSVANTNGDFKSDGLTLDDGHWQNKFADWMMCNGCNNRGLYNVNLDKYESWINNLIDLLGGSNIDYLGPWNEDAADTNDYTSVDVGITVVGVETWGLDVAASKYSEVESAIDVAGAHNYISNFERPDLKAAYNQWESFAAAGNKPEWFTETTLYGMSTAEGIAHMLPAISAGIEKMIVYQAVPRIITETGSNGPHYAATKRLIDNSKGKGPALHVETNDGNGVIAAFKEGADLYIHLCNIDSNQHVMYIDLQNDYTISSVSEQSYGAAGSVTTTIRNGGSRIQVDIPAKKYVHITASGLSVSNPQVPPPTPPSAPPPTPPTLPSTAQFIIHKTSSRRVWASPSNNIVDTAPSTSYGTWVQWEEERANSNYVYLNHVASGIRLYSGDGMTVELDSESNRKAQWRLVDSGETGWFRLEHRKSGNWLHANEDGDVFRLGPKEWDGDNTKWKLAGVA